MIKYGLGIQAIIGTITALGINSADQTLAEEFNNDLSPVDIELAEDGEVDNEDLEALEAAALAELTDAELIKEEDLP